MFSSVILTGILGQFYSRLEVKLDLLWLRVIRRNNYCNILQKKSYYKRELCLIFTTKGENV